MALNSRSTTTERNIQRASHNSLHIKEQNRWEISSLEQNYKVTYHTITSLWVCLACQHLPLRNQWPHLGIGTASHVSMRLVLVGDSFIPKGPWELLWLVQAHRPVFGSVKFAPIKYEKSFVPRHMKSDKGLFCKSISVPRNKYCLEFSIAWIRLKIFTWLFHSGTIFEAYLRKFTAIFWSLTFHMLTFISG